MTLLCAYSFDEASGSVLDYSGNGHSFTLTGNTVRSAAGGGHTDKGLTQSISSIDAGPTPFGLTANRTIMMWIKSSASVTDGRIFETVASSDSNSIWEFPLLRDSSWHLQAWNSSTFGRATLTRPTDGAWHHIAGTYDGTSLRVYQDGVLAATTTFSGPLRADSSGTTLNIFHTAPSHIIDDLRVYDEALDATAITTLMNTPVSIANTWTSSATITASVSSASIDITAAPVGDWVYCFAAIGANQTSVSMTGWTLVIEGDESTTTHYALFRRLKQSGDTTFTMSWPTSSKGTFGLSAWTGLDPTTPDELAQAQLHTSGTSYPTPSLTPGGSDRYAATFTYSRTSTSGNKAIAFTPAAGLVERLDFNNSAAASAPWTGQEIADSSAPVTAAAHSYTAVQAFSETHGGAILLYLVPPQAGITGTVAVTQAADTATASGQLGYSGTSAATQAGNASSAAGTVVNPVTGTAAASQASQAATATGQLGYSGTSARTQSNQTSSASGKLGYAGAIAAAQAANTSAATGTFSAGITGTAAATQAANASTAAGQLGYAGTATANQAAQTSTASGTFTAGGSFSGAAAVTQAGQTGAATGQLGYTGTVARTQANNTSAATGTVVNPVTGSAAPTQANQTSAATGRLGYIGAVSAVQAAQTSTAAGTVSGPVTGTAAAHQADQTASITGYFTPLVTFGTASAGTMQTARAAAGESAGPTASTATVTVPTATGG